MKLTLAEIEKHVKQNDHTLELCGNIISPRKLINTEIQFICHYLKVHPNITTLSVNYSNIGAEGAKALAANTALTTLNAGSNFLSDVGAKALALSTTLTTLNVRDNIIGVEGANALARNTTLTSLDIRGNYINN